MLSPWLNKLFPHPLLTTALWGFWLLLNNTIAAGHVVLGLIIAILIPFMTSSFWPEKVRIRTPLRLVQFSFIVLWDIVIANMMVAKLILGKNDDLNPAFFYVDLDIKTSLGISILANTISLTPGTVSCELTQDRSQLLVHALHVDDINEVITLIKQRYEKPLIEVFTSC